MEEVSEIWNRINSLIRTKNITQSVLSLDCGFNARRIQNLSGANRLPDAIEITKIAKALNTSVEYLVTGEETNPGAQTLNALICDMQSVINKYSQ